MGFFKHIVKWRDRRHNLIQLNYEVDDLWRQFNEIIDRDKLDDASQAFEQVYSEYRSYLEIPEGYRDKILTAAAVERARRWEVQLPSRATGSAEHNEYWEWNRVTKSYSLTMAGHRYIRHEVALEREIAFKPWLSWGAVIISFVALIVSVLKP